MPKPLDLIGQKFGMLTVVEKSQETSSRGQRWICVCDCGNIKQKSVQTYHLTHSKIISCGCVGTYNRVHFGDKRKTHGSPDKKLYWVWSTMKGRCLNPKNKQYKDYGARGINVCFDWLKFENFYNWALCNGYTQGLKIERMDNNSGYSPNNCKWANNFEQSQNRRRTHHITRNGVTKTIAEWCRELGLNESTIHQRFRKGCDIDKLFNKPKETTGKVVRLA